MDGIGTGYSVDIESGRPIGANGPGSSSQRASAKINRTIERGNSFVNDLAGTGGQVVKEVIRLYASRVNALVQEDPECIAYEKLLSSVEIKINMGKEFSALRAEGITNLSGRL